LDPTGSTQKSDAIHLVLTIPLKHYPWFNMKPSLQLIYIVYLELLLGMYLECVFWILGVVKELNGWQLQSHVEIEIHVIDINDKIPTFKQTYYTPQISEDYPLNTPIINFTVTDDDARNTPNSNITLDLIDPYGKFSIYNDTRVSTSNNIQAYLIAKERLDYESLSPLDRQYKLKIIARDQGQPQSLQSEAQIYITITDVNDEVNSYF